MFLARISTIVASRHQQVESDKHGRERCTFGNGAVHAAVKPSDGFAQEGEHRRADDPADNNAPDTGRLGRRDLGVARVAPSDSRSPTLQR